MKPWGDGQQAAIRVLVISWAVAFVVHQVFVWLSEAWPLVIVVSLGVIVYVVIRYLRWHG